MEWTPEKGKAFFEKLIDDRIEKLNAQPACDDEWVTIHSQRVDILTVCKDKCEALIED